MSVWTDSGSLMGEGMLTAILSVIFFGSFGVPIKSPAVVAAQVSPLAYQSYKSAACALTSCLALLFVDFKFTLWGVAGAAMWVVNGMAAIVAIRRAGLAVSQTLWSGLSIVVSFTLGVCIYDEPVRDMSMAVWGIVLMTLGIVLVGTSAAIGHSTGPSHPTYFRLDKAVVIEKPPPVDSSDFLIGIGCAVYNGIANGAFMVPLKQANKEVAGLEYLFSFGMGSAIVTTAFVLMSSFFKPVDFQLEVAFVPGMITGILWSLGNWCGIIAISELGMAIGWPIVQCNLLISVLWGLFYYKEIKGIKAVSLFSSSTAVVVLGIVLLAAAK